jgi:hypothetical protein
LPNISELPPIATARLVALPDIEAMVRLRR